MINSIVPNSVLAGHRRECLAGTVGGLRCRELVVSSVPSHVVPLWRSPGTCLAIPAQVIELVDIEHAVVDMGGVRKTISTALVDDLQIGDYVIVHVGYALNRLDPEEAAETLRLIAEFSEVADHEIPG